MRGAKPKDIAGQKFGFLTAVNDVGPKGGMRLWLFRCDCGGETVRSGSYVVSAAKRGSVISCGCALSGIRAKNGRGNKTHGWSQTRIYGVWRQMLQRCENSGCKDFPNYGGRGITVYDDWHNLDKFITWASASGYSDDVTIERINVNDGYHPLNCTWTPNENQGKNTRKLRLITFGGRTEHAAEWARLLNAPYSTIRSRVRYGWSDSDIIGTPFK